MNAGTADGWIGDFCQRGVLLHPDGSLGEFKPAPGTFTYRNLTRPPGAVLIAVAFGSIAAAGRDPEGIEAAPQGQGSPPAAGAASAGLRLEKSGR